MDPAGPPAPLSDVTATSAVRHSGPRRLGRRTAGWLIALASLAAVLLRIPYVKVPSDTDEGGFAYVAHRWSQGAHLYQDVWVDRPPLLLAVFRWATAIAYE